MKKFLLLLFLATFQTGWGQFAPPAGQPGSSAVRRDSSSIIAWATTCQVTRGFINIADTTVTYNGCNKATYGAPLYATGPADDMVISLGDHGQAVLSFASPIVNGPGADFTVFENAFNHTFLELAFVEVSSDGRRFVRFPSISLTETFSQVGTFDTLDARKINNLAGKYQALYGTPFDLQDLMDSTGIDLNDINYVKIIDVGGAILDNYTSNDAAGNVINDPWPTPFDTGGFDLDAVGVIHNFAQGIDDAPSSTWILSYPNPFKNKLTFLSNSPGTCYLLFTSADGRILFQQQFEHRTSLDCSSLPTGIYIARLRWKDGTTLTRKVVKE